MNMKNPSDAKPTAKAPKKTTASSVSSSSKDVPLAKSPPTKTVSKAKPESVQAVSKPAPKVSVSKSEKARKPKLVRDSLTMPKAEYEVLALLKSRATSLQTFIKKTELIRAGIKSLAAMNDAEFLAAIKAVPSLKTGRPKQS